MSARYGRRKRSGDACFRCGSQTSDKRNLFCSVACRTAALTRPAIDRFVEKIERTEACWLWRAQLSPDGYGIFAIGTKTEGPARAHRWSYEHFVGPIPEGLMVRHACHNRSCVNPEHLSVGSHQDNMDDMKNAGRSLAGGKVANARLDSVSVQVIRCVMATKVFTQDQLAKWWGVSRAAISHAVTGRNWGLV